MTKKELFSNKAWQDAASDSHIFVSSGGSLWTPLYLYKREADGYVFLKDGIEDINLCAPFNKKGIEKHPSVIGMPDDAKFKLFYRGRIRSIKSVQLGCYGARGVIEGYNKVVTDSLIIVPKKKDNER